MNNFVSPEAEKLAKVAFESGKIGHILLYLNVQYDFLINQYEKEMLEEDTLNL